MFRRLKPLLKACGDAMPSCSSACEASSTGTVSRAWGRWHSGTAAKEGKSMLDSGASMGTHTQLLEHAAEARLHKIKTQMNIKEPEEEKSILRRALGLLGNVILLGGAGAGTAATYYWWRYDTKELESMVEQTRSQESNAFPGSKLWVDVMSRYLEFRKGAEAQVKSYTDPTYHKLLPDLQPELRGRLKTLVLDLDDVLVHKEWTRQKGWQIFKRPGVQDFIAEMGQYFELVIFTDEPANYTDPIINRLDTHRVIPYRLYRPETQYHEGKHVRDLSKLNRDLSQVLFISANPDAYIFQPENAIKLKSWENDPKDTTLLDLMPMLQLIATRGVKDVRDVVKAYDGEEDIAKAFKARMQHMAEAQKQPKQRGFLKVSPR